jgi:hypothetical protein
MALDCDDPGALAEVSACWACLSAQQHLAVQTYLLCQISGMNCDPQTLIDAAKCFMCLSISQLQSINTYLLCMTYNAGGGGGGSGCVECGIVNPTVAPASNCCIYYRTDNGAVWFWNGAAWIPLITA